MQVQGKSWDSQGHVGHPVLLLGSGGSLQAQNLVFHITYGCYFHPLQEVFILSVLVTDSFKVRRAS